MKNQLQKSLSTNINNSILNTLSKYFPPKQFHESLIDIINVLMDGLSRGDIYIDMSNLQTNIELKYEDWPIAHKEALIATGWTTGEKSPIVLNGDVISWRRTHNEMESVIQEMLSRSEPLNKGIRSKDIFDNYELPKRLNQEQKKAINLIEEQRIIMLSGGPGTGKTSTILQMLLRALIINPKLKIAIAAPTGKATRRLKDTIQAGIKEFETSRKNKLSKIPCQTLHKWLESNPNGYRRNSKRLLNIDLIVIDEMSMVDMSITNAFLNALPKSSQIILVGDPDQLSPIGSGAIWQVLQDKEMKKKFKYNSVDLIRSYRNKGDIALLRDILKKEGLDPFWHTLSNTSNSSNVSKQRSSSLNLPKSLISTLIKHKTRLRNLTGAAVESIPNEAWISSIIDVIPSSEIIKLFTCLENLLVLCPQKYGHWGTNKVNEYLLGNITSKGISSWEQATPVICGSNQAELGLANGDVGLVIGEGLKRRLLFNILSDDQKLVTRLIHPSRVNVLDPAYAMTIHKSQGSEADQVILLWTEAMNKLKSSPNIKLHSREYEKRLIYTAITRAKKQLTVITDKNNDFKHGIN